MRMRILLALEVLGLAAPGADAQIAVEGSLRGTVTDAQGGVLPGVTITATSQTVPTPLTAVTENDGG